MVLIKSGFCQESKEETSNSVSETAVKDSIIKDLQSAIEELENTMKVQDEVSTPG